jgi:hypothetical protein
MMAESAPLLGPEDAPEEDYEGTRRQTKTRASLQRLQSILNATRDHLRAWKNLYLCAWLIIALEIPMFLSAAPGIQLMEDAVCHKIYGKVTDHDVCQSKDVQMKLAEVRGIIAVLATTPSMLRGYSNAD